MDGADVFPQESKKKSWTPEKKNRAMMRVGIPGGEAPGKRTTAGRAERKQREDSGRR